MEFSQAPQQTIELERAAHHIFWLQRPQQQPRLGDITISGTLPVNLTVKVFGYEAGYAGELLLGQRCHRGHLWRADSGPISSCLDGLKCFAPDNGLAVDQTGTCVEETYCASAETISNDCVPLSGIFAQRFDSEENTCVSLSSPGTALEASCGGIAAIACGTDLFCDFGASWHRRPAVNALKYCLSEDLRAGLWL